MSIMQMLLATSAGGVEVDIASLFDATTYAGNGDTRAIDNDLNISGTGGLVWIKNRDLDNNRNTLCDTVRGIYQRISSDLATPTTSDNFSAVAGFRTDGFVVKNTTETNASGYNYVAWCFLKGENFFDCLQYNGNNSEQNISHNLGSAPGMILIKNITTNSTNWRVFHKSLGANKYLTLNATSAVNTLETDVFPSAPTSSVFTVGSDLTTGSSNNSYMAYLFADTAGAIKTGDYTGTGSSQTISCGFQPQFVMLKASSTTSDWVVFDASRGNTKELHWNLSDNEDTVSVITFASSGFTVSGSSADHNQNGADYVFMAIAASS